MKKRETLAVWSVRDFRLFSLGTLISALCGQMLNVSVEWEIYERTGDPLVLGFVGLTLALPVLLLALPAGAVADALDRRRIAMGALFVSALASLSLAFWSYLRLPVPLVYGCLLLAGASQAFVWPAMGALLPLLVPEELLSSAITWNSSRWQVAATVGPVLGGGLLAVTKSPLPAYVLSVLGLVTLIGTLAMLRPRASAQTFNEDDRRERMRRAMSRDEIIAGARFVKGSPVLLATMAMDMAAVLLGGAVFLMPVFAKDILDGGPELLGVLKTAPSLGAVTMAFLLNVIPIRRAGRALLWAVAGFGVTTIVFGLSRSVSLSLAMLFLTGLFDQISVVVRSTLVTVLVPDAMRGRVSSVNQVFIGASNELGGFESGLAAKAFGAVNAVVWGGVGTLLVVGATAALCPPVLQLGALRDLKSPDANDVSERAGVVGAA